MDRFSLSVIVAVFLAAGAVLLLGGCGTTASVNLTTPDGVQFSADVADFKDRESINIDVVRDPETGRITGFSMQSTNSLTSPVAELNARAVLEGWQALSALAERAVP